MPKRPPPVTPEGFLATQDLRERGWTTRLIREFLGEHDAERANGLKMGRRRLPPVKLYREERVSDAEREEAFLVAQGRAMEARERAERAGRTRRANRERALSALVEEWVPSVQALPVRRGAVRLARAPYARDVVREVARVGASAGRLSAPEERFVRRALAFRLDAALASAYAWFPVPKQPDGDRVTVGARDDGWED